MGLAVGVDLCFTQTGRLVTFHSQIPHPSTTQFFNNPIYASPNMVAQHHSQPQTYADYERYRALLLETGPTERYWQVYLPSASRANPKDNADEFDASRRGSFDSKV